ncbi:ANTAR domain-containing protein [Streptomyces sp. NPDC058307]|uniref:ANTAR domain-containing protein n=1 Tax=Streptomyces sp. NPDC058307 TaxID=3346439 RepID=UPI0036F03D06
MRRLATRRPSPRSVPIAWHWRTPDLQTAMESRSVIDQAIGVIMGRQRCGADEACNLLRTASQRRNVKLREVYAELIRDIGAGPSSPGRALRPRP